MAKPNFSFQKRQKELAKKKKKELKRQAKLDKKALNANEDPDQTQEEGDLPAE